MEIDCFLSLPGMFLLFLNSTKHPHKHLADIQSQQQAKEND